MKNLFIKAVGGLLFVFVAVSGLIFLSAWTFNYWQAWTFLAVFMVSIWGLLMVILFAPVMAWRILDEEKLLTKDLKGYAEYRDKVKYRLVPFVW